MQSLQADSLNRRCAKAGVAWNPEVKNMMRLNVLRAEQHTQWMELLAQSFQYDFYHLSAYHALAEKQEEGQAHLFIYREGHYFIAIPLLLRSIGVVPGLAEIGVEWWDATSVYGYAGPIASRPEIPSSVIQNFRTALHKTLQELRVVAVFSRLHPLIPQHELLSGLGPCIPRGQTVSIDLTLPLDMQRARYRKNHKHGVNKLRHLGVTCLLDQNKVFLNEFINIYHETMNRVSAANSYLFGQTYFRILLSALDSNIRLFICLFENKVICGGLFTLCDGIVQYHLGGTRNEFLKLAPTKLLFDTVRLWSNERGARVFHLGGGVGSQEDTLFQFKAGFSDRRHEFAVWQWVLLPDIYDQLCQEKSQWNKRFGLDSVSIEYFPAYRCPTIPVQAERAMTAKS